MESASNTPAEAPKKTRKRKGRAGESATSVRRLEAYRRQQEALEYRKMGATFAQIAEKVGYKSPQAAHVAVMAALKKMLQEPADQVRKLELERVDAMFLSVYPRAITGDMFAIDKSMALMNMRARLLGLHVETKNVNIGANPDGAAPLKEVRWTFVDPAGEVADATAPVDTKGGKDEGPSD